MMRYQCLFEMLRIPLASSWLSKQCGLTGRLPDRNSLASKQLLLLVVLLVVVLLFKSLTRNSIVVVLLVVLVLLVVVLLVGRGKTTRWTDRRQLDQLVLVQVEAEAAHCNLKLF